MSKNKSKSQKSKKNYKKKTNGVQKNNQTYKSKNKHSARSRYRKTEPVNRNINSGDDDNVESLTSNADGNDVGME